MRISTLHSCVVDLQRVKTYFLKSRLWVKKSRLFSVSRVKRAGSRKRAEMPITSPDLVSRSQTFRLTAEGLDSIAAFLGQEDVWLTYNATNHSSFCSASCLGACQYNVDVPTITDRHAFNKLFIQERCASLLQQWSRKLHILLKIQRLVDPGKRSFVSVVNTTAFFFHEGFWCHGICFQTDR